MPIRFRCVYCNQLMGIARRKAGSVVRCPKCAGQVVVPLADDHEQDDSPRALANPEAGQPQARENVFEHGDFEELIDASGAGGPQVFQPPPRFDPANPAGAHADSGLPEYEAVPLGPLHSSARGVFVTSGVVVLVSALIIILVGIAFFLGVLLGRSV